MNTKVYEIVTDRIISLLSEGVCPWRRPWNRLSVLPQNFASGRTYSGINFLLLMAVGYELPYFLTFRQATERGGSVKKGAKGLPVIYWSTFETEKTNTEKESRKIPFLRYYTVFNASQIDGVMFPAVPSRTGDSFRPIETAEHVVSHWRDGARIIHGYCSASYSPSKDEIHMPSPSSFDSPAEYYCTLFHEIGHATGATKRLNRPMSATFGSEAYSREELVAEMTAAFLCAHCGIDHSTITNQAAYIAGWLAALKADPKLVVSAASQAQKAANHILGIVPEANSSPTATGI